MTELRFTVITDLPSPVASFQLIHCLRYSCGLLGTDWLLRGKSEPLY